MIIQNCFAKLLFSIPVIFIHILPIIPPPVLFEDYNDVIMGAMASQITSLTIVYSTVYSGTDQRKHQSPASLAFVREIQRGPVNSQHQWPVTWKMFPFDDVIMKWSSGFQSNDCLWSPCFFTYLSEFAVKQTALWVELCDASQHLLDVQNPSRKVNMDLFLSSHLAQHGVTLRSLEGTPWL